MPFVTHWERRGERRGRKEGRKEGILETVLPQLKKKVGEMDAEIKAQVEKLSLARLTQLSEALLDFSELTDLEAWLNQKPQLKRRERRVEGVGSR